MELRVSKTVSFHPLLPSNLITNEKDVCEDIKGSPLLSPCVAGSSPPPFSSRGASSPAPMRSGAHHGMCQMPGAQTGPRWDQTDSRRAGALLTTKKYAPDSNFSCGHKGNTLLRCLSVAMVRDWEQGWSPARYGSSHALVTAAAESRDR